MRILVINPFGGTERFGRDNLALVARPDTDFDIVNIGDVYPLKNNQWLYFRHECIGPTVERALQAERPRPASSSASSRPRDSASSSTGLKP
ncbi:MAG: hypothetical protein JOZ87_25965 [Chloroflexi bacterium]|nr:hypothetical protein [Chloroflexota bacterium]